MENTENKDEGLSSPQSDKSKWTVGFLVRAKRPHETRRGEKPRRDRPVYLLARYNPDKPENHNRLAEIWQEKGEWVAYRGVNGNHIHIRDKSLKTVMRAIAKYVGVESEVMHMQIKDTSRCPVTNRKTEKVDDKLDARGLLIWD